MAYQNNQETGHLVLFEPSEDLQWLYFSHFPCVESHIYYVPSKKLALQNNS